mmetsp:Transcript_246/g.576  ORF Transcript_246/g.576 Transcript_246/m.576 type:complete len:343 (-) Transcript_246:120-1148(-)|eukprot:CAMPEP_0181104604 /NCGR_PEP_ID=MMETSP1071-20121207/15522_1 /TAXON_ID=35127 /ORGANISM="Thalassiosira sp., Strain NH16" /LENGTH=342 /DNA_ID=CAMNT_0023187825 /DNA_START=64 /DNA_END=1092 /DNA_ORIENTATION=+
MGFPIKKRMKPSSVISGEEQCSLPSGFDLLSAAIESRPQQVKSMPTPCSSGATIITTSTAVLNEHPSRSNDIEVESSSVLSSTSSGDTNEKEEVDKAMPNTYNSNQKRAKTFPDILMDILANPDYTHIVGWLPGGKSFAIHSQSEFSSQILPKYFRRVIFRSFVRKLNRWGFRSVRRSISGFESTFEHKYFCRDEPEICAKMYCKSNPTSRPASKRSSSISESSGSDTSTVSPSNNLTALSMVPVAIGDHAISQQAQPIMSNASILRNEEFQVQLNNELMLREMQQRRRNALVQLIHHNMPMSEADIVSQFVAAKWQQILMSQQHQEPQVTDDYNYRRVMGL